VESKHREVLRLLGAEVTNTSRMRDRLRTTQTHRNENQMAQFAGLDNSSIVDFAVASGLETFEINGTKVFDDSGKYYVSQRMPGVIEIVERPIGRGMGHQSYAKFTITIQENPTRTFTD